MIIIIQKNMYKWSWRWVEVNEEIVIYIIRVYKIEESIDTKSSKCMNKKCERLFYSSIKDEYKIDSELLRNEDLENYLNHVLDDLVRLINENKIDIKDALVCSYIRGYKKHILYK